MDGDRFDSLAKHLAAPATRRAALGSAAVAGVLSALGFGRSSRVVQAAQGNGPVCTVAFATAVRQGPSADRPLVSGGAPGELRGELNFTLGERGNLGDASLRLPDGTSLPVVGQATGYSLQVRIELAPRLAVVAVGVGEQEIAACTGAIDGPSSGPQVGDIGDWHAGVPGQTVAAAGGREGRGNRATGGNKEGRGNRADRGNNAAGAAGAASAGNNTGGGNAGGGNRGGGGNRNKDKNGNQNQGNGGGGTQTPSVEPAPDGTCTDEQTNCDGKCFDLNSDAKNCGDCGFVCAGGMCQKGRCSTDVEQPQGADLCPAGEVACDGECTNLLDDPYNCGKCGTLCAIAESCNDGVCGPFQCPGTDTFCNMACVNILTSPRECGSCTNVCAPDQFCQNGTCVAALTCSPGGTFCREVGSCRDLMQDDTNCGECGVSCVSGFSCRGGDCIDGGDPSKCVDPALYLCNGRCVDITFDPANCGLCGVTCGPDQVCQNYACIPATAQVVCPAGQRPCDGINCVDLKTNADYCGACNTGCIGVPCIDGFCGGPPDFDTCAINGLTNCDGACVDLATDRYNCGSCGDVCSDDQLCTAGMCGENVRMVGVDQGETEGQDQLPDCAQGLIDCGGICVDATSDPLNCGGCGILCSLTENCVGGFCVGQDLPADAIQLEPPVAEPAQQSCEQLGMSDCGGSCVDLSSDSANCGVCGVNCGADPCVGGLCTPLQVEAVEEVPLVADCAAQGLTDCGGTCADLNFDSSNCGGCGTFCLDGQACNGGACS